MEIHGFKIEFTHHIPLSRGNGVVLSGTICTLSKQKDKADPKHSATVEFYGRAYKSNEDQYSKRIGRKISLRRAVQRLYPKNKSKRRDFWRYYFSIWPDDKR